jgi:hypothetical protein
VRFGRVPKREKARLLEEMQRASLRSQLDAMTAALDDDSRVTTSVTCAFTRVRSLPELLSPGGIATMPGGGGHCPFNSTHYVHAIDDILKFATAVPGFLLFSQQDRVLLLKVAWTRMFILGDLENIEGTDISIMICDHIFCLFRARSSKSCCCVRYAHLAYLALLLSSPDKPAIWKHQSAISRDDSRHSR